MDFKCVNCKKIIGNNTLYSKYKNNNYCEECCNIHTYRYKNNSFFRECLRGLSEKHTWSDPVHFLHRDVIFDEISCMNSGCGVTDRKKCVDYKYINYYDK